VDLHLDERDWPQDLEDLAELLELVELQLQAAEEAGATVEAARMRAVRLELQARRRRQEEAPPPDPRR